eukprot:1977950-Ditylum_brightwellii.AAC.1
MPPIHVGGEGKEDACEIIVLLIMHHLDADGEMTWPLDIDESLTAANACKAFDTWLATTKHQNVQQAVKKAVVADGSNVHELTKSTMQMERSQRMMKNED